MNINEVLLEVGLGVAASLVAAGFIWFFRRQLREAFASLDLSTGAILAWALVYLLIIAIIVFPLMDKEIPILVSVILPMLVIYVLMQTVHTRRK